jgi:hypothetical protein
MTICPRGYETGLYPPGHRPAADAGTVLDLFRRAVDGPCFLSHLR